MAKPQSHTQAQPWERQADESERAYAAFRTWLEISPSTDRAYLTAYRQFSGKPAAKQCSGIFNSWIARYRWQARALAYDNDALRRQREAELRVQIAEREKWAKRRAAVAEEEWVLSESLRQKAREMLQFPLATQTVSHETTSPDGQSIYQQVTIEPGPWRMRDAAAMLVVADRLARLATDQATEITELTTPAARADTTLRDARLTLAESRELHPELDDRYRAETVARAFGVAVEDLLDTAEPEPMSLMVQ